jgi:hypothetical protein
MDIAPRRPGLRLQSGPDYPTAPFVSLLGTVWDICHALLTISAAVTAASRVNRGSVDIIAGREQTG